MEIDCRRDRHLITGALIEYNPIVIPIVIGLQTSQEKYKYYNVRTINILSHPRKKKDSIRHVN